jgi:metal-sulfur cluster biosynthetic enzyme
MSVAMSLEQLHTAPVGVPPDYKGPEHLRDGIFSALQQVIDPELALSIVSLGLVYGVEVVDSHVTVCMTMTSPACPVQGVIVGDIDEALDKVLPPEYTLSVGIGWEPPWEPSRMDARARKLMGW